MLAAIDAGVKEAQAAQAQKSKATLSSNGLIGSRADLKNDYMTRAIAAEKRLYGNSLVEGPSEAAMNGKLPPLTLAP